MKLLFGVGISLIPEWDMLWEGVDKYFFMPMD